MKKFLPDLIAILAFIILSFAYFFPADIEGRILFQHDTAAGVGAGQESKEYLERTGERARWTNSIFGGMPTYQMSPSYDSTTSLKGVEKVYRLFLPDYVVLTFIMMLGFYILLRAFRISAWLAGLGGVIWAFSSYFFILIPAGHIWKFVTLAYIPPTIAGVVLAYRKKYLLGGIITALFPGNTFNENNTAYWHKSVGGYHAAKLRRYQEMIDHHIMPEMQETYQAVATAGGQMDSVDASKFRVLNMLNTKYFIFPAGEQGQAVPVVNPYAYGNAWFVDKVQYVNNANEEIDALNDILPTETAVVDVKFKEQLKGVTEGYKDSLSTIQLTSYEPNRLVYNAFTPKDGVVVFSEIYYPGWQATIDGQPVDIARADYILRAINVPAGEHTIEMWFDPQSIQVTESIAYAALALLLIGVMVLAWTQRNKIAKKS